MKVCTPLIAWHNRERVSSADFQPIPYPNGESRLATGGDDKHVVIWELAVDKDGKVEPQCLCDLSRHQNSVNIVRWSPNGRILASGDTDCGILLWQYSDKDVTPDLFGEDAEMSNPDEDQAPIRRENWVIFRTLRGHLQDVVDISWSPCSTFLVSCSTDNTAIVFDTVKDKKVKILGEHKGWVNGVAWDPNNQYLASIASDRCLRMYKTKTYKIAFKTYKANLPVRTQCQEDPEQSDSSSDCNKENEEKLVRLFHDDTFQSFYRRLAFSPDGELLAVPSGVLEIEGETSVANCTYIFSKANLAKPVLYLPNKEFSVAVRFSPIKYDLRPVLREGITEDNSNNLAAWEKYQTLFCLPYRMVYAVATNNTVVFYDTQQAEPFAKISKIHYIGLNDLTWSSDGNSLFICSTDGYCTIASFREEELGKVYSGDCVPNKIENAEDVQDETEETAETEEKEVVSKDGIPLDSEGVASPARIHIRSVKEGGKSNPKRLQLITLSSPKAEKKNENKACLMDVIDDGATKDLSLVYEDDDETKPSSASATPSEKSKKRIPLTTVSTPAPTTAQTSNNHVAIDTPSKVGRRVSLITLCSPSDPKK